jgi:RNA polymerase sigma factor (sigma-70 family)
VPAVSLERIMAQPLSRVLKHLRHVLDKQTLAGDSDAELLNRFLRRRDEAAFEAIMRRHGPMVFGVCWRVLRHEADAEDAYQAVFMVLIRKASSLRSPALLGNWLYGIAYRTALEAKRSAARRRAKETAMMVPAETPPATGDDLREALDQELERLPHKYRAVLVLCDLEGKTRKEAARQLGWPEGTVAGRLVRARALLARRIARRGFALSSAALATALADSATAGVPPKLVALTVKTAFLFATKSAAGLVSTHAAALAEGVLKMMLLHKLKMLTAILVTACCLGHGGGSVYYRSVAVQAGEHDEPQAKKQALADQPEVEKLRQEVRELREKMAALERRLGTTPETQEVFYQGKPAAFWRKQLRDTDPAYRMAAVNALAFIGQVDRSVLPAIVASLKDRYEAVCQAAVDALAATGPQPSATAEAVAQALQRTQFLTSGIGAGDASNYFEQQLSPELKKIDPTGQVFVPFFIKTAKGADLLLRRGAIEILGYFGPTAKAAVPMLIDSVKDPDVHWQALTALASIDRQTALPFLIEALKSDQPDELQVACSALTKYGPEAKAAVPGLIKAFQLRQFGAPNLNSFAARALQNIDPKAAEEIGLTRGIGGRGRPGGRGKQ